LKKKSYAVPNAKKLEMHHPTFYTSMH